MPCAFKRPERRTYCSKYPRYTSQTVEKLENFNLKKAKKAMAFSPNFPLGWPFGRHNHVTTKKWSLAGYSKAVI